MITNKRIAVIVGLVVLFGLHFIEIETSTTTAVLVQEETRRIILQRKPCVVALDQVEQDKFVRFQQANLKRHTIHKPLRIYLYLRGREGYLFENNEDKKQEMLGGMLGNELKHFILDGIVQSPYLQLVPHIHQADVVVGRTGKEKWCGLFQNFLFKHHESITNNATHILIMDWDDLVPLHACPDLVLRGVVAQSQVFYTKRAVVRNRHFNVTTQTQHLGELETFLSWRKVAAAPVRHTPYAVRTDLVQALEKYLLDLQQGKQELLAACSDAVVHRHRPKDVAHFWPSDGKTGGVDGGGKHHHNSYLRDNVSRLVESMGRTNPKVSTFAGVVGKPDIVGRNQVDSTYAQALLDYKIIIVAQKDDWEDHYRLFEALISGALVLSDVMLSIPPDFVDGESIVFFYDLQDLKQKIVYYLAPEHEAKRLQIAQSGFTLVLHRHRSWHRMEEVFFGQSRSPASVS